MAITDQGGGVSTLIQRLPPHVIRQIAAGEVIDRPYSVVKELIENALDAGATRLEIELEKSGLESIKVIDNGSGISTQDLPLVFERYATSKLHQLEDLLQLSSFGFRGEAVYAIASVAEVTLQSKTAHQKIGAEIQSIRGKTGRVQPIGHRQGTTVLVRQLFSTFPVRKKTIHLRKELKDITTLIQAYSVEFPKVHFALVHDGQKIWTSFGEPNVLDRLEDIWSVKPENGIEIKIKDQFFSASGWMSTPEHFVSHRKQMICFINHRMIDAKIIFPAVSAGIKTFFHRNLYPQLYLSLTIPSEFLDVNLHPQKKTVKFLHAEEIFRSIEQAIANHFQQTEATQLTYTGKSIFPETGVKESSPIIIDGKITQLHQTYLLVPTNQGFLLVDQHAGDERLWYNRLLQQKQKVTELEKNADEATLAELADDEYVHSFEPNIDARVAIIACHTAIRAGQILSQSQMQDLVQRLLASGNNALVCPHGRPTYVSITVSQLARMFRR